MILETVAVAILLALLLLVVGLLVIPFDVTFQASRTAASTEGEISIRWLGLRLLHRRIAGGIPAPEVRKSRSSSDVWKMIRLARQSVPSLVILFRAFRRSVSIRKFSALVNLGLGDPAETALISGYFWAFSWAINLLPGTSIILKPDLDRPRLDGSARGELSIRLLPLAVGFLRAFTKKPFRALVREARRRDRPSPR